MSSEAKKEADVYEIGVGFSGTTKFPIGPDGKAQSLLNVSLPQMRDGVREGLATIEVHVFDSGKPIDNQLTEAAAAQVVGTADITAPGLYGALGTLDGLTLIMTIDGGTPATLTFDGLTNSANEAAMLAAIIATWPELTAVQGGPGGNKLVLTDVSGPTGASSTIDIDPASTSLVALGLAAGVQAGADATFKVINAMVQLQVDWNSGRGSGTFFVDATRDCQIVVGGDNTIRIQARMVSSEIDPETGRPEPIVAYIEKTLEANVHWKTSANPKPARITLPTVSLTAIDGDGIPGPWQRIPLRARDMIVNSDTPESLGTLLAEFSQTDDPGARITYAILNPNATSGQIWHGVEFVRLTSPVAMRAFCGFDTWS